MIGGSYMYLKRLEILGFKSFANKTVLDFQSGVTGIVGPNGSGKSNVIDALRWILGESSSKSMRADKAENLIFSGTDKKTRSSMAQVSVVFDNSKHFFPVDYEEVSIRRKLTRDGSSQYFINESEVRLKDVVNFFSQARLGTKGFTIINQGSSDLFIRVSPKDRRVMMEEILGLRQYQIKRHDAENKLAATANNLDKARALIDELMPHLRFLRRQVKKWQKYDGLVKELREAEDEYFSGRLYEINSSGQEIEPKITSLAEDMKAAKDNLNKQEEALKEVEKNKPQKSSDTSEAEKEINDLEDKRLEIARDLARIEAELEFAKRQTAQGGGASYDEVLDLLKEARKLLGEIGKEADIENLLVRISKLTKEIDTSLNTEDREDKIPNQKLLDRQEKLNQALREIRTQIEARKKVISQKDDALYSFTDKFKAAFSKVEEAKINLSRLENEKERLNLEKDRAKMQIEDLKSYLEESERGIEDFQSKKIDGFSAERSRHRLIQVRSELSSIGEIDQEMVKEADETEKRYENLSTQAEDLEKATGDLKQLIKELKKKLHNEFDESLKKVNKEFAHYFSTMFGGGTAKLKLAELVRNVSNEENEEGEEGKEGVETEEAGFEEQGLDIQLSIPRKNVRGLDMLSGGERSLVSIAVLFALISVSPPPFLVLDEVDAALDENNTKRFASLIKEFCKHTQFVIVTHNRATMGEADVLYGVTMGQDGTSRILSLKLEEAKEVVK